MTMVPKTPLEKLVYFQEEMDRLFHLLFNNESAVSSIEGGGYPLVDVYEKDDKINFEFEAPDVDKKDLVVLISNDLIIVEGVKREKTPKGIKNYICMERSFGKFQRVLKVPSIVDTKNAKAKYADGILTVTFPKIKERRDKSKKITIE